MKNVRRTDIDTLRAISVIAVIIYHFDKSFFPYGYLGVDIFFVISGYVITRSILRKLKENKFKFTDFYYRRIKRILPVLLVVLLATFFFANIIFLTADLKRFLESLISSLGFISNFYFWITGGYFSTNDQLKPLLHLWSLSVEEQFYIFFPIVIYFVTRFIKKYNFYLLLIFLISISSFLLNLFIISKGHKDFVFFMFPTRVWQFGLGVFFAFLPNLKIKNIFYDFLYLLFATFLIILNFSYPIKDLPSATLMCIGVSLILYKSINERNKFSLIFKSKSLIFIGLISYSLYLWHWPIISFLKYIFINSISIELILLSTITIFSLSFLSWKYIEQPFLIQYSKKTIFSSLIAGYLILILGSFIIIKSDNFPSRYEKLPNDLANSIGSTYSCSIFEYIKFGDTFACLLNSKNESQSKSILFGNSHAYMYGWGFKEHLQDIDQKGIIIQLTSCLPFIDKNISQKCLEKSKNYYDSIIARESLKNIILGFTWDSNRLVDDEGNIFIDKDFNVRKKSIDYLIKNFKDKGKTVFLIGPILTPEKEFSPEILSREIIFKERKEKQFYKYQNLFDKKYEKVLEYYRKKLGNKFLLPHEILCKQNKCFFANDEGSFFSDTNHLSKYGSLKMKKIFKDIK